MRYLLALALLGVTCGGAATPAASTDPLAGTYRVGGGDAALAQARALTDAFAAKHPGVEFTYDATLGSDGGVNFTARGTLDVGMASRELTQSENDAVDRVLIGVAGTGLLVHQSNTIRDLARDQVNLIYSGRVTDWNSLGLAKQLPIIPLVREKGSSARTAFETYVFGGKPAYGGGVLEIQGGDQVRQAVAGQPGAIGIIGVTGDDPAIPGTHLLTVDGVTPTKQALREGTYQMRRPLYFVYARGAALKPAISELVAFIRSPEGQKIIDRF